MCAQRPTHRQRENQNRRGKEASRGEEEMQILIRQKKELVFKKSAVKKSKHVDTDLID